MGMASGRTRDSPQGRLWSLFTLAWLLWMTGGFNLSHCHVSNHTPDLLVWVPWIGYGLLSYWLLQPPGQPGSPDCKPLASRTAHPLHLPQCASQIASCSVCLHLKKPRRLCLALCSYDPKHNVANRPLPGIQRPGPESWLSLTAPSLARVPWTSYF